MKFSTNTRWMLFFITFAAVMGLGKIEPGHIVHNAISSTLSKIITH